MGENMKQEALKVTVDVFTKKVTKLEFWTGF